MKIGVFDSGLGGLIVLRSIASAMPEYDLAYFGDTANLPYGSRSGWLVYEYTRRSVDWLFRNQDCALIILACNTATISALRRLQREYLPASFPDRRILGVVVPTIEEVAARGYKSAGLIATEATVRSGVYAQELAKINPDIRIESAAAPLIVPLVENCGDKYAPEVLRDYLKPLIGLDALILGCTHYAYYKELIAEIFGRPIVSQDDIIPGKLRGYLSRHPEIDARLGRKGARFFGITDVNDGYLAVARRLFGADAAIEQINME
ncbi:MAG: glutamate racemase [Rickettsiales bacterium]|nr:glutamate racemase [Rickettsiales bacterium]